ncbi:MAG: hypothetical protein N4J56_005641 [Chroococcidiopsis sp. SAG 2025]|uniref:NINE protein n=1 Tax=Chroococcidiopsis sp. SAG 2025 TaxID=171389 RepID=UPI0029370EBB|nr:NINE protein [Chroococcidiopsis sp. SAG 2025]MDV2995987.1 hypothetical protein [Chroococcidiopsis sp. SAG 2025]
MFFYFDTQTISIIPDVHKINVTDNKYYCSYDDKKLIYMRETGVAYILWCACFLGVCGVQRFYCGKYISGIIYLFTLGLFGLGQLVDLALIPGMVEDKNLKYKLLHGSPNVNTNNSQSVVINLGEQVASLLVLLNPQPIKNLIFKLFFN